MQACRTRALACNPAQLTEVAEVAGALAEAKAATRATLTIKTEVTAKPTPAEGCTRETPVTPEMARGEVGAGDMALTSCWWLIHYVERDPLEVACYPEVTHAEMLERYPDAIAAEPFTPLIRQPSAPLTASEETAIRTWLALIEETDPATIAEVIERCQRDADARDYFTDRAAAELTKTELFSDDRRTCDQCANLIARRCRAAKRGEIVASRNYEPNPDLPRRCEGYAPDATDPDRQPGRERWPGLTQKGVG